jgi:hypothetical protein
MSSEKHHILFHKTLWTPTSQGRHLRNQPLLIPKIDSEVHTALHKEVSVVPLPDYNILNRISKEYRPFGDHIMAMNGLMVVIQENLRRPRVDHIQRALGELTMHAIELQIPFIREGLVDE